MEYRIEPIGMDTWLPDRCMPPEPFDPDAVSTGEGCPSLAGTRTVTGRNGLLSLYREVLKNTGCCGFIARDGIRIVGYNNFFPLEIAQKVRFYGWGDGIRRPADQPTLVHHCISLVRDTRYRRKRIGTALVTHSLNWAASNGWRRFEVHLVLPDTPGGFTHEQKSCRSFWQRFGFHVFREGKAGPETRELYGVDTRYSMALGLGDWEKPAGSHGRSP